VSAPPLPRLMALSCRPPWSRVEASFFVVCAPLYPALLLRAFGHLGRQVTLSPCHGLEVRVVTAVIRLDRLSWPCLPFMG
jgi:hypothetical protein